MKRLILRSSQGKRTRLCLSLLETHKALLFKMQVSAGTQCEEGLVSPEGELEMSPGIL